MKPWEDIGCGKPLVINEELMGCRLREWTKQEWFKGRLGNPTYTHCGHAPYAPAESGEIALCMGCAVKKGLVW